MVVLKVISAVEKEKRKERGEASTKSGVVARRGLIKKMGWPDQQRQEL